jgi:fructuronate reductase
VHLGLGAFARAHLAAYTDKLLAADPSWGIAGVSLRRPDTEAALAPQDGLYTLAERDAANGDAGGDRLTVIGALTAVATGTDAALRLLTQPATRIATLTVTEKAYCRQAATGALDEDHPDIRHDLREPHAPRSVPGILVEALARRRQAGIPPFTVLCCDNLPANGKSVRAVTSRLASLRDPALGDFVAESVAFPDTMVDRIVPATTDADRARIDAALGLHDAWPVVCEGFCQWVIEDRFPQGRPAWEQVGAELVRDVLPYETMKLRLLNGAHSSIAYLGQLAGWETVADAIAIPALRTHIAALMAESATTLRLPAGADPGRYAESLLARFANPALRHRTAQIAMDGSQKLPQRLFAPALDRIAVGEPAPRIALGVAAWLHFLRGTADDGAALPLDDPHAQRLRAAASTATDAAALFEAIAAMPDIMPQPLARDRRFAEELLAVLESLATHGAAATLDAWITHRR